MNLVELLELKYPGKVGLFKPIELIDRNDGKGIQIGKWDIEDPIPTKSQLQQWALDYELAYRQKLAVEKRVYPPIASQLDMQYNDLLNGTTTWRDTIAAVKAAFPKPTK